MSNVLTANTPPRCTKTFLASSTLLALGTLFVIIFIAIIGTDRAAEIGVDSRATAITLASILLVLAAGIFVIAALLRGLLGTFLLLALAITSYILFVCLVWEIFWFASLDAVFGFNSGLDTCASIMLVITLGFVIARQQQPQSFVIRLILLVFVGAATILYLIDFLMTISSTYTSVVALAFASHKANPIIFAILFIIIVAGTLTFSILSFFTKTAVKTFTKIAILIGLSLIPVMFIGFLIDMIMQIASDQAANSRGFYTYVLFDGIFGAFLPAFGLYVITILSIGNTASSIAALSRRKPAAPQPHHPTPPPAVHAPVAPAPQHYTPTPAPAPIHTPVPTSAPVPADKMAALTERLKNLDALKAQNLITPEEYDRKRQELLAHL